jgi:Putative peptidoglycan binding domain
MTGTLRGIVGIALALVTTAGLATPAEANVSQGFLAGAGVVTDDFGDEGTLSTSSHANSYATGYWQAILWADGALESNGTTFDEADIDCQFGPNTAAATRNWQSTHGVGVDGVVGPQTFGRADNNLSLAGLIGGDQFYVRYNGRAHSFRVVRNGEQGVTPGFQFGYFTLAWDLAFFTYSSNINDCGGSPNM